MDLSFVEKMNNLLGLGDPYGGCNQLFVIRKSRFISIESRSVRSRRRDVNDCLSLFCDDFRLPFLILNDEDQRVTRRINWGKLPGRCIVGVD